MKRHKKGTESEKYSKTCYFSKKISPSVGDKLIEEEEVVYPFAVEFKKAEEFWAAYRQIAALYDFKSTDDHETWTDEIAYIRDIGPQVNNEKNYCKRCLLYDCLNYATCKFRSYVAYENKLRIEIRDHPEDEQSVCPSCKHHFYNHSYKKSVSTQEIQDVRFLSRPSCLIIKRGRIKCPNCGVLLGNDLYEGFQAYCHGKMTPRLAENVLFSHLSSVKREFISEAYGLSKSQIDRIYNRMILYFSENQAHQMRSSLELLSEHLMVHKKLKDGNTGHVYHFYFDIHPNQGARLLHIMLNEERKDLAKPEKHFIRFLNSLNNLQWGLLSFFCCLKEDEDLTGSEVLSQLGELTLWLNRSFLVWERQASDRVTPSSEIRNEQFFTVPEMRSELHKNLRIKPEKDDEEEIPIEADKKGQYVLSVFLEDPTPESIERDKIEVFLSRLSLLLEKYKTPARALKEKLLILNPVCFTKSFVTEFMNTPEEELEDDVKDWDIRRREQHWREYGCERWSGRGTILGVPVRCLLHLMEHGLLDPENDQILPCGLTKEPIIEKGKTIPPCGISDQYCPYL